MLSGLKQQLFFIAPGFCWFRIWVELTWENLLALWYPGQGHPGLLIWKMGCCGGPKMAAPHVGCMTPWQRWVEGWAQLGQLMGTSSHGLFSIAVSEQLNFLHGGWLYPQSKHPKGTVALPRKSQGVINIIFSLAGAECHALPDSRARCRDLTAMLVSATV